VNLSELKVFKAVYECGGVSQAAVRLHCVQSNVTARLKQLETRLGVQLFARKSRRMEITPRGKILLDYAERLLGLAEEATQAMQGSEEQPGMLRIGSMETTAAARLPTLLTEFYQQQPTIEMQLLTGPTRETIERVREFDLDVGFVAGPVGAPDLEEHVVWQEKLVLITEKHHPPVKRAADVVAQSLLVFRQGCQYRQSLESWFAAEGVTPRRVMEFGSFQAIIGCVQAGMGVGLLPISTLELFSNDLNIATHALPAWCASSVTSMVWRASSAHIFPVRLFVEFVQSCTGVDAGLPIDIQHYRRLA